MNEELCCLEPDMNSMEINLQMFINFSFAFIFKIAKKTQLI